MTTPNGHHQVDVFEGVKLPPDAETQAPLELMALADAVEAGRLTVRDTGALVKPWRRCAAAWNGNRPASGRRWPWRRSTCGGAGDIDPGD